jgi:hypothetical protein
VTSLTPEQLFQLARQAGFSDADAVTQTAISLAENRSSDPEAKSPPNKNGTVDAGLNQINQSWWAQFGGLAAILDPLKNFQAALAIKKIQGWDAWSTYTPPHGASGSGVWRNFLPQARAAAQSVLSGNVPTLPESSSTTPTGAIPGSIAITGTPIGQLAATLGDTLSQAGQQGQQAVQKAGSAEGTPGALASIGMSLGGLTTGVSGFLGLLARMIGALSDSHLWWRVLLVAAAVGVVIFGLVLYLRPPIGEIAKAAAVAA